ncbi:MAG: ATP synthase F1 subunit delta [Rickettsiales bacterium]
MSTSHTERLTIASRYAEAIFALSLAAKKEQEVVGAIVALSQALGAHDAAKNLLANPLLSRSLKSGVLVELLAKADKIAADSVRVIAEQGRAELLPEIAELLAKKLTAHKGELNAHVTSARALSAIEQKEVAAALTEATGKKVNLTLTEDAAVIGGLKVRVGSHLLDGTVETALKRMRQQLLAA